MAAAAAAPARPPSAEALFDLAAAGDAAGIREALGNGANAMTENKSGDLPIHIAAAAGHVEACAALAAHTRPIGRLSRTSKKSAYDTLVEVVGEDRAKPLKDAEEHADSTPISGWLDEFNASASKLEERIERVEKVMEAL